MKNYLILQDNLLNNIRSSQQPTEQHSLDKVIISENRPFLHHADEILEKAMNHYWRGEALW